MKKQIITLAAAALACASAHATNATLYLWDTTGDVVTVHDGGAGDSSAVNGKILFDGSVGANWTLVTDTGLSTGAAIGGSLSTPVMDVNFSHTSSSGAGTLTVAFFDNDFSGSGLAHILSSIGGTFGQSGVTLTYSVFTRAGDAIPANLLAGGSLNLTSPTWTQLTTHTYTGFGSFGSTDVGGAISGGAAGDYSLLQVITITAGGPSLTTGDAHLTSAPDGGTTMVLLGSSLTALGLLRRSFKSVKA
jgi:hypothetical protein